MELDFLYAFSVTALEKKIPGWGQFELTPVCNLKCKMCYVHKPEEDARIAGHLLPASFWLETARQAAAQGMLVLSLTGGETLLYPDIDELMEGLSKMGLLISFNTNGTLVDEARVRWFQKYGPTKINISLYGASDETYEAVTGVKNGFSRVSKAISLLQEAGLNVYLNGVIIPENRKDLPAMHRFADAHGLELHTSMYIFPPRGCAGCPSEELNRMDPKTAAETYVWERIGLLGMERFRQSAASAAYRLMLTEKDENFEPQFKACRAGQCSFAVNHKGMMQPCVLFDKLRVPVAEMGFSAAWEELKKKMEAVTVPESCMNCRKQEICPVCKAAIYQETGGFTEKPSYLCEYTDHLEKILKKEGSGVEIRIPDRGDFSAGGCSE